jgi:uncharacterized membrane protein
MIAGPFVALLAGGRHRHHRMDVEWASDYRRSRTALDILTERFARSEVDREEYASRHRAPSAKPRLVRPRP